MSYDLMVFNHLKAPCELAQLKQWFCAHMENDRLSDVQSVIFGTFIENIKKVFLQWNIAQKISWNTRVSMKYMKILFICVLGTLLLRKHMIL